MTTTISRAAVLAILRTPAASDTFPDMIRRVEALEGCGVDGTALMAASEALGRWMSAALEDPQVCAEMKADINAWFAALEPVAQPEPGPASPYAGLSGIWSSSIYADHSAPDIADQNTVHLNMLRGTIAKPTVDQIIHIYGVDVLCKALAPQIVREAVSGSNPMWCDACRATGAVHCAHPDECGNMLSATGAADQWKSWLDDLPLPFTFDPAIGRLQDFITALTTRIDVPQPHPPREPGTEPTPGQFTTMCLAIEDVVTGRGFDVDPWQPIETAPKDGTLFLAYYPSEDGEPSQIDVVGWPQDAVGRYFGLTLGGVDPTHWMPLPKPPGETTSAIPEEVKAYLRNALMVGGWKGERE